MENLYLFQQWDKSHKIISMANIGHHLMPLQAKWKQINTDHDNFEIIAQWVLYWAPTAWKREIFLTTEPLNMAINVNGFTLGATMKIK